jgi:hypothetical protein
MPQADQRQRRWQGVVWPSCSAKPKQKEGQTMKRKGRIRISALAIATAGVLAGSALASSPPTLTIRHQLRCCHAWSFNGGAYKASLKIRLARGTALKVVDNDLMPHKLVQLAGPKAKLISPAMKHMSAQARVIFAKKGTYKFTTKPGEDYMKGIKTVGPDNVLRLIVTVS